MKNVIITLERQIVDIKSNLKYYRSFKNLMNPSDRQKTICDLEDALKEYLKAIEILKRSNTALVQ